MDLLKYKQVKRNLTYNSECVQVVDSQHVSTMGVRTSLE